MTYSSNSSPLHQKYKQCFSDKAMLDHCRPLDLIERVFEFGERKTLDLANGYLRVTLTFLLITSCPRLTKPHPHTALMYHSLTLP
ncbi:hypothetical protein pdam_00022030 [Pocillopora damicornis]|uniref:Uncharacterized protein n=1 Tax=Pocillopora damicornis TaxID=46731 RepID=A0A3M6UZB4_POCDA|nr:hypothetical protein pdam_00022030 [Pocillopora damicornis]